MRKAVFCDPETEKQVQQMNLTDERQQDLKDAAKLLQVLFLLNCKSVPNKGKGGSNFLYTWLLHDKLFAYFCLCFFFLTLYMTISSSLSIFLSHQSTWRPGCWIQRVSRRRLRLSRSLNPCTPWSLYIPPAFIFREMPRKLRYTP